MNDYTKTNERVADDYWKRFKDYPFITTEDQLYHEFLIYFLEHLEPRQFKKGQMLCTELESPSEMYFIMTGKYDIGYELNSKKVYRLQFGERTIVGGFNMAT